MFSQGESATERRKTGIRKTAVRKSMVALRELAGADDDSAALIQLARKTAKHRVIVKSLQQTQRDSTGDFCYRGNGCQISVYLTHPCQTAVAVGP